MIARVTDPTKIVTDELLKKRLLEQGIDYRHVELWHDYAPRSKGKEYSPYAKFYQDLVSGKRLMVSQGLPKVDAYGIKPELTWVSNGKIYTRPNLFYSEIDKKQVRLVCLNDQPYGAKRDDEVTWAPQLFIDGSEVHSISDTPILLDTDPYNQFCHFNVLEWDYGVCKRRARIIEGRFSERWSLNARPKGRVRVKHNPTGKLKLRFGSAYDAQGNTLNVTVIGDEEIIEAREFDEAVFPVTMQATLTVYPDADAESATVDGSVKTSYGVGAGVAFATMHDLAEAHAAYSDDDYVRCGQLKSDSGSGEWRSINRGITLFDISGAAGGTVTAVTLTLVSDGKAQTSTFSISNNVYSMNISSNTDIVVADYLHTRYGVAAYCDTPITYAAWAADGSDNDFAFNANPGIVAAQAAVDGDGILKLSIRDANYDVADGAPGWENAKDSYTNAYGADKGVGYKPKLVVTYTPAGWAGGDVSGVAIAAIAKINGIASASIAKVNGVA